MSLSRQRLIVSLFPNRVAAGVFQSGQRKRVESIELNSSDWQSAWSSALTPYDPALRQLLARLRLPANAPITVLYHSPTAIIRIDENRGTKAEAEAAALLRFDQSNEGSSTIRAAEAMARSAKSRDDWIVVTVSEREETANAIYTWVARCGGALRDIQPTQAAVLEDAFQAVQATPQRKAACVIDQEWSAVVAGDKEGIELARIFELGYRLLTDAYASAYRPGEPLSHTEAERALMSIGVPTKRGSVPDQVRQDLLPRIAPIVQRLSVEIKQTLRYGLSQGDPPDTLTLEGRGAAIPEIASVLAEGVDMHVKTNPPNPHADQPDAFTTESTEHAFAVRQTRRLALRPSPAVVEQGISNIKRAMLLGASAAMIAIAGEFAWVKHQHRGLDPAFEAISGEIASIVRVNEEIVNASGLATTVGRCAAAIEDNSSVQPDIEEAMGVISHAAGEHTRLSGVEFQLGREGATLTLTGHAEGASEEDAAASLQDMVGFIESQPSIEHVEIGAVSSSTGETPGSAIRRFSLTAHLKPGRTYYEPLARFANATENQP